MSKEAIIIGYSGHAYVVLDVLIASGMRCKGYCEQEKKNYNPYKLRYVGGEHDIKLLDTLKAYNIYIGIGDNKIRADIYKSLNNKNLKMPFAVHPSGVISLKATIGDATVVMPGAVINTLSKIGVGVICNTACIIEHECVVGDFSHIAPGAVLAGNVTVGSGSFIGANAIIKQGVKIGKNVIIGAGSVVLKNVSDNQIVYGNPAK